jgi:hypothetical protein
MVPRTISATLPGLKVSNFAAVCLRFVWRRKTLSKPVGLVVLNSPLWPRQDRAVAPGLVRQLMRGLAVLVQRYRQTDRWHYCLPSWGLTSWRQAKCQLSSVFLSDTQPLSDPSTADYAITNCVSRNALTLTDLNGQGNAFSLQCLKFSRKWFLNNLILAAHLVIPSLSHGRCSD